MLSRAGLVGNGLASRPRTPDRRIVKNLGENQSYVTVGKKDSRCLLTSSEMRTHAGELRRADKARLFTFALLCSIGIPLVNEAAKTKIDDVHRVARLAGAEHEVAELNVTMDDAALVNRSQARNELICEQECGLEREVASAKVA